MRREAAISHSHKTLHRQEADEVHGTPHKSYCYRNEQVVDMQLSYTAEIEGHLCVDSFQRPPVQVCHTWISDKKNDRLKA